jgi:hypothetical protein
MFAVSYPPRQWIFKGDKNPLHAFLRRASKTIVPHVIRFYGMLKKAPKHERDNYIRQIL